MMLIVVLVLVRYILYDINKQLRCKNIYVIWVWNIEWLIGVLRYFEHYFVTVSFNRLIETGVPGENHRYFKIWTKQLWLLCSAWCRSNLKEKWAIIKELHLQTQGVFRRLQPPVSILSFHGKRCLSDWFIAV